MAIPYITRVRDGHFANFTWMRLDNPQTGQPVIEFIRRPNVNGYAFRRLAEKGEVWSVIAMRDFINEPTARSAAQYLRNNLVGEMCEVTAKDETTYGRMMCLRVEEVEIKQVKKTVGGIANLNDVPHIGSGGLPTLVIFKIDFVHVGPPPA